MPPFRFCRFSFNRSAFTFLVLHLRFVKNLFNELLCFPSKILDAISYVLSSSWNLTFCDSDFYKCNTDTPIEIETTLIHLPENLILESKYGLHIRGLDKSTNEIKDDLEDDVLKNTILKSMMEQPPLDPIVIDKSFLDIIIRIRGKWYKKKRAIIQREITMAQGVGNTELSEKLVIEKDKLLKEEVVLMNS